MTLEHDSAVQGIGQLARESSGDFVRSYFYDHLSRPVSTVESHGFHSFAVSRSYDGYGRPDAMTYPTGLATRQVYTANGHLNEVQNAATTQLYWRALAVNARGQITQEVQGNGVVTDRAFDADSGHIDGITSTFGASGDVQKAEFDFDLIGNLTARRDRRYSTPFSETFGYDTLNRLQTVTTTGAAAVTATYNDLGNITSRTDVGSFSYGAASTGPHALTGVTGGAFNKACGYDAKGNRTTDGATSLTYSSFNKPVRMVKGGDTLRFDYGPDRALYRQTTFITQPGGATSQTVREYIGGLYERETTSEGLVRHIHYIAGGSGVAAIHTDERSASTTAQRTRYIHKDHLGSVDVITDSAGAVVERQSFDAWGRRRTVAYNTGTSSWSATYPATPGSAETHRGFTGHEMLDAVGLVHMGGRIYDPITARFLSPDPFVQSPDNLQNLNRYSYVLNNPLSFTDPSGFFFKSIGKFFKKHWKTIAAVAVGIATGGAFAIAAGAQGGFWGVVGASITGSASFGTTVAFGVGSGFGSAFSGTLLAGGSVGDALRAGLTGGVSGGVTAGLFKGIDVAFPEWTKTFDASEPLFSPSRVINQTQRMTARAGLTSGISHLSGGKAGVAFRRTLGWDSLGLAQDLLGEMQWRSELSKGMHRGNENAFRDANQGLATAKGEAAYKPASGEAVRDFHINNIGKPLGELFSPDAVTSTNLATLATFDLHEGSPLSRFLAFRTPGIHQVSIYHDFAVTVFEGAFGSGTGLDAFSIGSAVPYAGFVYGRYGHEARLRAGQAR